MYNKTFLRKLKEDFVLSSESMRVVERILYAAQIPYPIVRKIAAAGYSYLLMEALHKDYMQDADMEQFYTFVYVQAMDKEIAFYARALEMGLETEKIMLFADGTHTLEQAEEMLAGFLNGRTIAEMELATDNRLDGWQIAEICDGFKRGLAYEQVEVYARECFDHYQMQIIKEYLLDGFTLQEAASFANPCNNTRVMQQKAEEIHEKHMWGKFSAGGT